MGKSLAWAVMVGAQGGSTGVGNAIDQESSRSYRQ